MLRNPSLYWQHSDDRKCFTLHTGNLPLTELARVRRSNNGKWYFLEIDLPNYDLPDPKYHYKSRPFAEQIAAAETFVRAWFNLALEISDANIPR